MDFITELTDMFFLSVEFLVMQNDLSLQKLEIALNFIASGLGMLGRRYTLGEFFGGFRFLRVAF